jgi:fimbrial isopeptide formation D2 family protein/LPXTG-motif cell wall-anchored protein
MRNVNGKKLIASLATVAAALGLAVGGAQVASAARPAVSITVKGAATSNRTYKAIKLADYTAVDTTSTPTSVTVATVSQVESYTKTALNSTLGGSGTNEDPMSYVADHWGNDSRTPEGYAGQLRNFLTKLSQDTGFQGLITASSLTSTATTVADPSGASVPAAQFTGLDDGIYMIEDAGTADPKGQNTLPILVSTKVGGLTDAQQPGGVADTVDVKATFPGKPKKSTSKNSYNVGDLVDFKIETTVPTYTNYQESTYVLKVSDTLSKGLTYDKNLLDAKVSIDGGTPLVLGTDYTINDGLTAPATEAKGPHTFTFDLSAYMQAKIHAADYSLAGKSIVITYKAIMNEEAIDVIYDGGDVPSATAAPVHNDAKVTFTNDPNDQTGGKTGESEPGTTNVYTYKMQIKKVDKTSDQPLETAEFNVKDHDGNVMTLLDLGNGSYRPLLPSEKTTPLPASAKTTVVTPSNGVITINGLSDGTYTITETKAPVKDVDGNATSKYKLVAGSDFNAKIAATYDSSTKKLDTLAYSIDGGNAAGLASVADSAKGVFKMQNVSSLAQLPLTGAYGIGFLVGVGVLLIAAGSLLYFRARKNARSVVAGNSVVL